MWKILSVFDMWNYPTNLGRLVINIHSLETVIRTFLLINDIGYREVTKFAQSLQTLKMDQEIDENKFTNYDTLKNLIKTYNDKISSLQYHELTIDEDLVKLRDALAHGRAFKLEPSSSFTPLFLLKFSNPKDNKITGKPKVEIIDVMTKNWLDEKIKWTRNEYKKVIKACEILSKIKP